MINWQFYPKSDQIPNNLHEVVNVFIDNNEVINSENHQLPSDGVLSHVRLGIENIGYDVERSKLKEDKVHVPFFLEEIETLKNILKQMD